MSGIPKGRKVSFRRSEDDFLSTPNGKHLGVVAETETGTGTGTGKEETQGKLDGGADSVKGEAEAETDAVPEFIDTAERHMVAGEEGMRKYPGDAVRGVIQRIPEAKMSTGNFSLKVMIVRYFCDRINPYISPCIDRLSPNLIFFVHLGYFSGSGFNPYIQEARC